MSSLTHPGPATLRPRHMATRGTLVYVVLATLWIIFSDRLATIFVGSEAALAALQTVKGLLFVLITGLILYLVLQTQYRRYAATQETLATRERDYRTLVDNSRDFIVRFDAQLRHLYVNPSLARAAGIPQEEYIGRTNEELDMPAQQVAFWNQAISQVFTTGKPHRIRFEFAGVDGLRHYEAQLVPEFDARRQVATVLSMVRDVTDLVSTRAALQASEDRFRRAVLEAPLPTMIYADDGEVIDISQSWLEITGYQRRQLTSLGSWTALAYGSRADDILSHINQLFTLDGRVDEGEFAVRCQDGTHRVWVFSSAPLGRLADGRQIVMSVATDVTERQAIEQRLRDNQRRLENAEHRARLGSWDFDPQTNSGWWSRQMFRLLRLPERDVPPDTEAFLEQIHPEDRDMVSGAMALLQAGRRPPVQVYRTNPDLGSVRYLMATVISDQATENGPDLISGTLLDVTDLYQTSRDLENTVGQLRALIDLSPAAIIVVDDAGIVHTWNRAAERIFGWRADEVLGQPNPVVGPNDRHFFDDNRQQLQESGFISDRSVRRRRKDGLQVDLSLSTALIPGEEAEQQRYMAIFVDVTARRKAEAALRRGLRREKLLRRQADMMRRIAETFVSTDRQGVAIATTSELLRDSLPFDCLTIFTVEGEALVRSAHVGEESAGTPAERIPYTEHPLLRGALRDTEPLTLSALGRAEDLAGLLGVQASDRGWYAQGLLARGFVIGLLVVRRTRPFPEPETVLLKGYADLLSLAMDHYHTLDALARNITALQQAQDGLVRAARLAAIGELAAGVAHQINNPLMTVVADSHLLLQQLPPEAPGHESAAAIQRAARRAGSIVQRLLDYARMQPEQLDQVDIDASIQETVTLLRPQFRQAGVTVSQTVSDRLPTFPASRDHLQDVWANLLLNARDAVKDREDGRITIRTQLATEPAAILITISDNGHGIPAELRGQIFDPFFSTKSRGTGLGLAICREVIEGYGGTITVESAAETGTTFTVQLPLTAASRVEA